MYRKSLVTVWVGVLAVSFLVLGCPKKKPAPGPEMEITEVQETFEEVEAPTPPPVVDETPDPFSEDIETANIAAYEQGLLGDVYFDFDKYDLKPEARERLARNADFMRAHPEFEILIEGHCDERGTNEYNLALGDRRSNAAKSYLMSLGIPAGPVQTVSFGEERPQCRESTEACWWRNRRAHFVISGRQGD
jgi:peptidoglycan-associated lipoprotein